IDDSYTMSQTQDRMAANLNSLLSPLAGRDVNVKVLTTSDQTTTNYTFEFVKTDGTTETKTSTYSRVESDPLYNSTDVVAIHVSEDQVPEGQVFNLQSGDSLAQTNAKITDIKNHIISLGTNGRDQEKVMCPLARELKFSSTSFLKDKDKVAVVALTDEDDTSENGSCYGGRRTSAYGAIQTYTSPGGDTYAYKLKAVRVKFSYKYSIPAQLQDGIVVSPAMTEDKNDGSVLLGTDKVTEADITAGTCKSKAQQYIRSLGVVGYYSFVDSVVSSCTMETNSESKYLGAIEAPDYCQPNVTRNGLLISQWDGILTGRSYVSATPYISAFYSYQGVWAGDGAGNCTKSTNVGGSHEQRSWNHSDPWLHQGNIDPYYSGVQGYMTPAAFDIAITNKYKTAFGKNFFMSFIANQSNSTCIQEGQKVGARYEALANNPSFQNEVKTYSICSPSYEPALKKVSDFISQVAVKKYVLGLPAGQQVISVQLVRNGTTTVLDSSKYLIEGDTIELRIDLEAGDQIIIKH
ncbi:MAG: hypothetical protein AB7O96_10015, partial [Pseudobdellovibrionaceae bacterium]